MAVNQISYSDCFTLPVQLDENEDKTKKKKKKKDRSKQADDDVQDTVVEETAMVVDSERTFWFICFNICYYNYHAEPKGQEPGKKKKKKKHLEPVDEGRFKNCRKVEAA